MAEVSPKEKTEYRKEFHTLRTRSDFYRNKCALRATKLSRVNRWIDAVSISAATLAAGALSAGLSGFLSAPLMQKLALVLSVVIALLHALGRNFFNAGEIVKLFYAAGEFLKIKERAKKGKLHCGTRTQSEIADEYDELFEEYTTLRRAYIEYVQTPTYYRHKRRRVKVLGGKFTELPPMKKRSRRKESSN